MWYFATFGMEVPPRMPSVRSLRGIVLGVKAAGHCLRVVANVVLLVGRMFDNDLRKQASPRYGVKQAEPSSGAQSQVRS